MDHIYLILSKGSNSQPSIGFYPVKVVPAHPIIPGLQGIRFEKVLDKLLSTFVKYHNLLGVSRE